MLVPLSWLKDFAPIEAPADAIIEALDDLGLTVDGVERVGDGLADIVVARVLATRPHPDADRIQLVDVDSGDGEPLQVACGAFNFEAGDLVPLAPVGSTLPGGLEIGRRKMRGEWSNGMLCSATELELGSDGSGIMVLSPGHAPGTPLVEALGLEPDTVVDVDVTANRPDAMSVAGVARDLAARFGLPFSLPETTLPDAPYRVETLATVEVRSPELCPRFTARVLEGVPAIASPPWMQRRLTLAGMRPISLAVDASNYVMLELGHPTHPYDLDRLPGEGIVVRAAEAGEVVTTLDGVDRRTGEATDGTTGDCLICDANGAPIGIAGIMGGASTGVTDETTRVLLETAYFLPMAIARTSKRLRLRTEASARFERGVDIDGLQRAADRYCGLVGSEVATGTIDVRAAEPENRRTRVRISRLNAVLGSDLDAGTVAGYLGPIGFTASPAEEPGVLEVDLPSWRPDAQDEIDVVEEVARHHGYARLGHQPLTGPRIGGLTDHQRRRRQVRDILCGLGLNEASTPPMVGPEDHERSGWSAPVIPASNPMVREESVLRATLLPGLLRALAYNASHRNADVALYELGNVFRVPGDPRAELPDETERLTAVMAGRDARAAVGMWRTLTRHLRIRKPSQEAAEIEGLHPYRASTVLADGAEVGGLGEVHPDVLSAWELEGPVAVLDLSLDLLLAAPQRDLAQQPVSRFPSSDVDLAFEVPDSVPAADVRATIVAEGTHLLVTAELFDVYRGGPVAAELRSLAFRLRFQAQDRTLTDQEVGEARSRIIAAVEGKHSAKLRG